MDAWNRTPITLGHLAAATTSPRSWRQLFQALVRFAPGRRSTVKPFIKPCELQILPICILGFVSLMTPFATAAERPNVIVFLADDQGWGDLSANGNLNISTPNIDSLAKDGVILDRFYVCNVCAPTRAEFLTGRYYPRTGVSGVSRGEGRLNADESTIADAFKAAGYATGAFGKWHNGTQPPLHPNDRGFDEFYGFTSGHWGLYFDAPMDKNRKPVRGKGYIVDDLTTHAVEFIEANRNQPFFCYLPYNTPHSPMQVPDRFYDKFADKRLKLKHRDPEKEDVPKTRAALAMCENIDWNVGRVLEKLDELGIAENTIVLYFSDNGPNSYRWNDGMKGRKGAIDEGGVRVPFLARWPGHIPAGGNVREIAGAIDLLPTLADMAGIEPVGKKTLDGISIKSLLLGEKEDWPERMLISIKRGRNGNPAEVSVRTQQYRLDSNACLYDMKADPGQRADVSQQFPELTRKLKKVAADFSREMVPKLQASKARPFHVGYGPITTLPARDANYAGNIQRSNRAPNNSFFTNWTSREDRITWDVNVGAAGSYQAVAYYTCTPKNVGSTIHIKMSTGGNGRAQVEEAFDPPLVGEEFDRTARGSESFVKDFKPLNLGTIKLKQGPGVLTLQASDIPGSAVADIHSLVLTLNSHPIESSKAEGSEIPQSSP